MPTTTSRAELQGAGYKAMSHLSNVTHGLPLDPLLRELIRVRASMLNGCAYCVDMHTKDARAQGETDQRLFAVSTWHEAPFFSPAERAALALTDALTLLAGHPLPDEVLAEAEAQLGAEGLASAVWIIVTINAWNRVAIAGHEQAGEYEPESALTAAALRALHVPGDPLVLPNAWDAATARIVAAAGLPAVATTSSGVAEALGYEDGEQTPVEEMLAAVARIARAVEVPVTADMEAGYGLPGAELAERVAATGAVGLNLEDSDHAHAPALVAVDAHAERIAAITGAADLALNARIDVHLRGGDTAEALARARAYADAGAAQRVPHRRRRRGDDRRVRRHRHPRQRPAAPGAPPIARLAELGVARVSLGHFLHAEMLDAFEDRVRRLAARR